MKLEVEKLQELLTKSRIAKRGNLRALCPKCNEDEFYISYIEENHPFQCWRKKHCGYSGNIFTLLKDMGKLSTIGSLSTTNIHQKLSNKIEIEESQIDLTLPNIAIPLGFKAVKQNEYLDGRNFYSYHKIKVGITTIDPKYKNDYVIFILDNLQGIKGYIGRHIKSKVEIDRMNEKRRKNNLPMILRYKNSETDFSKILWGIQEVTDNTTTLILVEGLFDKDRIDLLLELDNQEQIKCCCTFGSNFSTEQMFIAQQKKSITNIIILYEADVLEKVINTASDVSLYFDSVLVGFINDKDPGDMEYEDLEQVLLNLQHHSQFAITKVKIHNFS